jgi:hypothetical protein
MLLLCVEEAIRISSNPVVDCRLSNRNNRGVKLEYVMAFTIISGS